MVLYGVLKCVKLSQLYMLWQLHGSIHGRWQTNPLEWVTHLNLTFRCLSKCDLHKSVNVRVYEQSIQNHISIWNEKERAIKKKEKKERVHADIESCSFQSFHTQSIWSKFFISFHLTDRWSNFRKQLTPTCQEDFCTNSHLNDANQVSDDGALKEVIDLWSRI